MPKPYLVRVYCLDARGVQPLDDTTSDPFLKLHLGSHVIDDVKNYIPATVEPQLFRYGLGCPGFCRSVSQGRVGELPRVPQIVRIIA